MAPRAATVDMDQPNTAKVPRNTTSDTLFDLSAASTPRAATFNGLESKRGAKSCTDDEMGKEKAMDKKPTALPEGCSFGTIPRDDGTEERVIWVEFPAGSRDNPFYFSKGRKFAITVVATFFTMITGESHRQIAADASLHNIGVLYLGQRHVRGVGM